MIVAIDPGASGGIAWVEEDGYPLTHNAIKMPATEGDIIEALAGMESCLPSGKSIDVFIEDPTGGMFASREDGEDGNKNGRSVMPPSAMFKFGKGYGFLLGACQALGWRVHLVRPHKWQKPLGVGTKGKLRTSAWKNKLKSEAQRIYPECKVTLSTADALLILRYGKKTISEETSRGTTTENQ